MPTRLGRIVSCCFCCFGNCRLTVLAFFRTKSMRALAHTYRALISNSSEVDELEMSQSSNGTNYMESLRWAKVIKDSFDFDDSARRSWTSTDIHGRPWTSTDIHGRPVKSLVGRPAIAIVGQAFPREP